jgi:alkylhydroperoxidase/carboxymuconolactone decarboxylase family protein YurZ
LTLKQKGNSMAASRAKPAKKDDLYEEGLKVRKQEMATRAWGLVWARPGLPHKIRSMLNIAFLIALDKPEELELHVEAARRNGVTPEEIQEILMQAAVYCGFPAALRGTRIARQGLERYDSKQRGNKAPARAKARR